MAEAKKISLLACLALMICLFLSGCGERERTGFAGKFFYEGADSTGKTVTLQTKPEKIVLLAPSFLGIMHAVGGDFSAWANSPVTAVPAYAKGKPTVGFLYQVNLESVIAEKPDLVIGMNGLHNGLVDTLEQNKIPVMILNMSNYDDVVNALHMMGDVTGHHEEAAKAIDHLSRDMKQMEEAVPKNHLTAAILHGTARTVTIERTGMIASEIAGMLGFHNVFAHMADKKSGQMPPFSMETLAVANPDVIFLTSMGLPGQAEAAFKKVLIDQPAWASLKAVREGRVYILPQTLFLSNPGMDYPLALQYMAHQVYPDIVPWNEKEMTE